ncbi:hypothetical protein, conserved in T.vivax [Trypanosoma vivax Y486]|uniref:Uncharacterized protein n=1 Tax=Trypanosoma vivax (strain Y486) TaxID=1055687 RepID=F9WS58_TRYVY|nr:hypothetical protein, conserved in T.vivax [Trypanosoma vivax Y486]|eukprot:CCD20396.1 hypothetical protein, conserved in T.vivax [Trypanosoma vivax Y486]
MCGVGRIWTDRRVRVCRAASFFCASSARRGEQFQRLAALPQCAVDGSEIRPQDGVQGDSTAQSAKKSAHTNGDRSTTRGANAWSRMSEAPPAPTGALPGESKKRTANTQRGNTRNAQANTDACAFLRPPKTAKGELTATAKAHKDGVRRRTSKGRGRATEPGRGRASQTWPDHRARRKKTAPHAHRETAHQKRQRQGRTDEARSISGGRTRKTRRHEQAKSPAAAANRGRANESSHRGKKIYESKNNREAPRWTTRERHTRPSDSTAVDISYGIGLHLDRQQKENRAKDRRRGRGIAPTGRRRHAGRQSESAREGRRSEAPKQHVPLEMAARVYGQG